jgi:hypothetical protein
VHVDGLGRAKWLATAVWDRDLYSVPSATLKDLHCELTMIAGTIRYRASTSPIQLQGD